MLFAELGIQTVGEFLAYYPRDYIDRSKTVEIYRVGRTEDDEPETIQGKVVNHTSSPTARGKRIGKISIYDGTGVALLVNFRAAHRYYEVSTACRHRSGCQR